MALPIEIHTMVAEQLTYPDLLALIYSHPRFQSHPYIRTSKIARIDWLIQRAYNNLPLPKMSRCWLSNDREFVDNVEVKRFIQRRRRHLECAEVFQKGKSDGCCFVVEGRRCPLLAENIMKLKRERGEYAWRISAFNATVTLQQSRLWQALCNYRYWWYAPMLVALFALVAQRLLK